MTNSTHQEDESSLSSEEENDDDIERKVHIRVKLGMAEINDVRQQYRPDVDIFFYYKATPSDMKKIKRSFIVDMKGKEKKKEEKKKNRMLVSTKSTRVHDYKNINMDDNEWPMWTPHFDFESEVDQVLVTDESYWINMKTRLIFGRKNMVPNLQNRINHTAFPYDRQILHIDLLSNNCLFECWNMHNNCPKELKLFYERWHIQGELNALADAWDLVRVLIKIEKDVKAISSHATLLMYIQREPEYYTYNISIMLFLIVCLQNWILSFPFDESRFDFALNLVLTQIAYRFVVQGLVPRTSYQMYLDKFMLLGFVLLICRFIIDFWLTLSFEIPPAEMGDDFKCGWRTNGFHRPLYISNKVCSPSSYYYSPPSSNENNSSSDDGDSHPCEICEWDLYITISLMIFWFIISIIFLIPQMWRRSWEEIQDALIEERYLDTMVYEQRDGSKKNSPELQKKGENGEELEKWLENNRDPIEIEKPDDIKDYKKEMKKMVHKREKKYLTICLDWIWKICCVCCCGSKAAESRNCKELRGWTDSSPLSFGEEKSNAQKIVVDATNNDYDDGLHWA